MKPRNVVLVLLDSLNRHMLGAYGGDEFDTPNLDRLAARSIRFDHHYSGSLPCIPARHDILCGAYDFLWKPWGSIEIWEEAFTASLRRVGVTTMLVSDHPHLFETGGENYHTDFSAWEYLRGHEHDAWKTRADPSWAGAPAIDKPGSPYTRARSFYRQEEDYPGPKTMGATASWLDANAGHHDRFLLFVDEFTPHEPFDASERFASMYDPAPDEPRLIWPPYSTRTMERGVLNAQQAERLRASYGATLTMIDAWFGRILDVMDERGLWDDTAFIVTTDHGIYLGEHDAWGKPAIPVFRTLGHIPMLIAWPGAAPGTRSALTTNLDLHATILDIFDATTGHRTHGRSFLPVVEEQVPRIRDHVLCGIWGREVHIIDERWSYARAPTEANAPLSMWSNRWSTMPYYPNRDLQLPAPDDRAVLDRMPGSTIPVIRQPFREGDMLPYWAAHEFSGHHLYDRDQDPLEERNLAGTPAEREAEQRLRDALIEVDAPPDQLMRLGLE